MAGLHDTIVCTVSDGAVSARLPDGAHVNIPAEIIARSTIISDMVSEVPYEGDLTLPSPGKWLQAWVQCAAAAQASSSPDFKSMDNIELAEHLKVRYSVFRLIRRLFSPSQRSSRCFIPFTPLHTC